jgi:hypothetical protein
LPKYFVSKDAGRDEPLLPSLTNLSIVNTLSHGDDYLLLDMVTDRLELGAPLRSLDLRACPMTPGVVELLGEMVTEIQGPEPQFLSMARWPTLSNWARIWRSSFKEMSVNTSTPTLRTFFDEIVNQWSHGYYDDEGEGEGDDDLNDVFSFRNGTPYFPELSICV